MAKQSREKIIAELEARQIGYNEEMNDEQLAELLKEAKVDEKKAAEKKKLEGDIDYSNIKCGLSTIQGLHKRLTIVERKLGLDK